MHVYEKQGEDVTIDWLKERNFDTDAGFKATLKALLQVLPRTVRNGRLLATSPLVGPTTLSVLSSSHRFH